MKQPKKLTRRQKEIVKKKGLNPNEWAMTEETDFFLKVINKVTGKKKNISLY